MDQETTRGQAPMTAVPRITPTHIGIADMTEGWRFSQISLPGIPRGAVILLYDQNLLGDQSVDLMNELAEQGFDSLAANVTDTSVELIDDDRGLTAFRGLVEHLSRQGWREDQIGVVGLGFGGRIALRAAADLALGAAVSISPDGLSRGSCARPALIEDAQPVKTPWLGMFGADDENAKSDAVGLLSERLTDSSPAYIELVTYPGVGVGFFRESAEVLGHAAMFDSRQRVMEWLKLRVVPRQSPFAEIWDQRQDKND